MKTVLVVDDTASFREAVAAVIQRKGYRVLRAADGKQALAVLADGPADLILLDVAMPVMDGPALLRNLRGDPRWRELPVILMTAGEGDSVGADDQHVLRILQKTRFSLAELMKHIDDALNSPPIEPK